MKLSRIAGLLAGVGILAGAQVALASDGTIFFVGDINANTCDISLDGNPDGNGAVVLPTVSANALTMSGATAGWTQFDIALTNCTGAATSAMAYFEAGPTVDAATGRLNTGGSSENVQIALRRVGDAGHLVVGGSTSAQSESFPLDNGAATLSYEAGYWATDAVSPGDVASDVTYSIVYQ